MLARPPSSETTSRPALPTARRVDVLVATARPWPRPRRARRPCGRTPSGRRTAGSRWASGWRSRRRARDSSVRPSSCAAAGGHQLVRRLEREVGQDRHHVGVAAALAVAVDGAPGRGGCRPRRRPSSWRPRARRRCGCGCPRRRPARPGRRRARPRTSATIAGSSSVSVPPFVSHRTSVRAPAWRAARSVARA